jgi:site-specific DNA recombinase
MKSGTVKPVRCAIYTRVSTDHGLEQDFNSLDAQHDAAQAYIRSQAHAGWSLIRTRYDDGGYSGGSTDRPALQRLLADVKAGKINVIAVYKVDRLTCLADFAKLVELFDGHGVSFVSVTQQFNTTTSMGRLTLNVRRHPAGPFIALRLRAAIGIRRGYADASRNRLSGMRDVLGTTRAPCLL